MVQRARVALIASGFRLYLTEGTRVSDRQVPQAGASLRDGLVIGNKEGV